MARLIMVKKRKYSIDTIHINGERIWKSIPAKISEGKIECSHPGEGFLMGFIYVTDVMNLEVSSELISSNVGN